MGLENVKKEIEEQAKQKAKEIIDAAYKEAVAIDAAAQAELKDYEKAARTHLDELFDVLERKQNSVGKAQARRVVLEAKKAVLARVVASAKEKLASMNPQERQEMLRHLLKKAQQEVDVETVFVNKQDLALIKDHAKAKETQIEGGLIAQNSDGTISVNLSVEELLGQAAGESLIELSEVLFGHE